MSDLPQQDTINQSTGDGLEPVFAYTYLVPTDVDINVYVTPNGQQANDQADIQPLGVAYTVQNAGNINGGTITFLPGFIPPALSTVTRERAVEASIDTNYAVPQTIIGVNLDDSFQRGMLIGQQNQTKFDERSLRFPIASFLPDSSDNNIVPILPENYIWKGTSSGKVGAFLLEENPDCSALRSELADENMGTNGAGLIGYYDIETSTPTTVSDFLNNLDQNDTEKLQSSEGIYGDDIGVGTNTWVVSTTPAYTQLVSGTRVFVKSNKNSANTPVSTLGVMGLPVKNIKIVKDDGTKRDIQVADIVIDGIFEFMYDGVDFQLINPNTSVDLNVPLFIGSNTYGTTLKHGGLIMQSGLQTIINAGGSNTILVDVKLPIPYSTDTTFTINVCLRTPIGATEYGWTTYADSTLSNTDLRIWVKSLNSAQNLTAPSYDVYWTTIGY